MTSDEPRDLYIQLLTIWSS